MEIKIVQANEEGLAENKIKPWSFVASRCKETKRLIAISSWNKTNQTKLFLFFTRRTAWSKMLKNCLSSYQLKTHRDLFFTVFATASGFL